MNFILAQGTIVVPPQGSNPLAKPGWKLVFNDEFDNLNLRNWDLNHSAAHLNWNAGQYGDDTPCCHEGRIAFDEPRQVSSSNGLCVISLQEADIQSKCLSFSDCQPLPEPCKYARTGEIKTFSYEADGPDFREWKIPEGCYIEFRAKVGNKNCNAWSAFWLYGGEQEIDVFETLEQNSPYNFDAGYWSKKYVNGEWISIYDRMKNNKIVSRGFRVVRQDIEIVNWYTGVGGSDDDEIHDKVIDVIHFENVDLSSEFVNYGVFYGKDYMKFFINGLEYFNWNLNEFNQPNTILPYVNPKTIRMGMGLHKDNCTFCPTTMEIDYLRVYTLDNNRYVRWLEIPEIMNKNEAKLVEVNYVPQLNYNWSFGDFTSVLKDLPLPTLYSISCPNSMQSGMNHTVNVTTTFPDQRVETLSGEIYVQGNEPPQSPKIVSLENSCFSSDALDIHIKVKGLYLNTLCTNNTGVYQWSTNGVNYFDGQSNFSIILPNEFTQIFVRISNCFGFSQPLRIDIVERLCDPHPRTELQNNLKTFQLFTLNGILIQKVPNIEKLQQLKLNPGLYILKTEQLNNGKLVKSETKKHWVK